MENRERTRWLEFLNTLPLTDLHRHFDGSIRPTTLWDLSERYYEAIPGMDFHGFERMLRYDPKTDSTLMDYLDKFHVPLQYTQFYGNIRTIAYEIAEDAWHEGVNLLELRLNPLIHRRAGLTTRQVINAALAGLKEFGEQQPQMTLGLVIIAMRSHGGNMAKILLREIAGERAEYHSGPGVVGFDIAGNERPFPPILFTDAFALSRKMGLKSTVHAGEAAGPDKIWEAVEQLSPNRIGHGTSAGSDPSLLRRLAEEKITVECCLTSNTQTGAVDRIENHPLPLFLEYGVPCTLCCDNATVSGTTITDEYLLAIETFGLGEAEVRRLAENGRAGTFCTK
jgi:adenosine deaminase